MICTQQMLLFDCCSCLQVDISLTIGKNSPLSILLATLLMSENSQRIFFTREAMAKQLKIKFNAAVFQTNEIEGKKDSFI